MPSAGGVPGLAWMTPMTTPRERRSARRVFSIRFEPRKRTRKSTAQPRLAVINQPHGCAFAVLQSSCVDPEREPPRGASWCPTASSETGLAPVPEPARAFPWSFSSARTTSARGTICAQTRGQLRRSLRVDSSEPPAKHHCAAHRRTSGSSGTRFPPRSRTCANKTGGEPTIFLRQRRILERIGENRNGRTWDRTRDLPRVKRALSR